MDGVTQTVCSGSEPAFHLEMEQQHVETLGAAEVEHVHRSYDSVRLPSVFFTSFSLRHQLLFLYHLFLLLLPSQNICGQKGH